MNRLKDGFSHLPHFSALDMASIVADLETLLNANRDSIASLVAIENPNWENFILPLDMLGDRLERFWSPVRHLNSVTNKPQIREAYNAGLKLLSVYSTELGQNQGLYQHYLKLRQSKVFSTLSNAQQKSIEDKLRDFRLCGIALDKENKQRFKEIALRLEELSARFSENVLDASNQWEKRIQDETELSGLPLQTKKAARQRAEEKGYSGWSFNLEFPTYYAIQTFAENRQLREEFYTAYTTRGSDKGPHNVEYNNDDTIQEILRLRSEQADLLGFSNFAEFSVETKMADSPQQVKDFLNQLLKRSKQQAEQEYSELQDFATALEPAIELKAWDIAYYSNKLKQQAYAVSDDDLKPYFPAPKVLAGLFQVVQKLFGLRIHQQKSVDVWHPDVSFSGLRIPRVIHAVDFILICTPERTNVVAPGWMSASPGCDRVNLSNCPLLI